LVKFETPLIKGKLIKRYKRFLADVELENGKIIIAHCTNSGSMLSCLEEGADVYLSPVSSPTRKTKFTWEMININHQWIGINTNIPNLLVYNSILAGDIEKVGKYKILKREVTFSDSRFDIYGENENEKCFIEVKNVSMKDGKFARFPDAITKRGTKHLKTLMEVKKQNMRAIMIYIIQRMDVEIFAPAVEIDPEYTKTLKKAFSAGVEIIPLQAKVTPDYIEIVREIPFLLR
jgi:sugar fermentation stimulation protein A